MNNDLVWLYDGKGYVLHYRRCADGVLGMAQARKEWLAKWPNYCTACDATGVLLTPGASVPYGIGTARLPDDAEPCESCIFPTTYGSLKCPRCGEDIYDKIVETHNVPEGNQHFLFTLYGYRDGIVESWIEEAGKCPECGWNHGEAGDDFFPGYGDGCICHEWHEFEQWWFEVPQPGLLQQWAHSLGGLRLQAWWSIPIVGTIEIDEEGRVL